MGLEEGVSGTEMGSWKCAAKRLRMPFMKFFSKRSKGLSRCCVCRRWKEQGKFYRDRGRPGGYRSECGMCCGKRDRGRKR